MSARDRILALASLRIRHRRCAEYCGKRFAAAGHFSAGRRRFQGPQETCRRRRNEFRSWPTKEASESSATLFSYNHVQRARKNFKRAAIQMENLSVDHGGNRPIEGEIDLRGSGA